MKLRHYIFCAVLAAGLAPLQASPQKIAPAHAENLENCLEGFASCDYAHLNSQEKQAVQTANRENNFMDCFQGFSDCDRKQLTAEQRQEVDRAHRVQNLQNCVDGIGECDTALLNDAERQQVALLTRA